MSSGLKHVSSRNWWFFPYGAPKNATLLEGLTDEGVTLEIHWACDLSGEEQPPFKGWFTPVYDSYTKRVSYYREVTERIELWRRKK